MFSKQTKEVKLPSIASRVTLWYTVFIALIFLAMFVSSFAISDTWSGHIARSELEHETMELSTDIDDFETFEDGIYFAIYNKDKMLEKGNLPRWFDSNAPFTPGKISKYRSSEYRFYYFDVYNSEEQKWVRGIRIISRLSKELRLFLLSLVIFAPISITIMTIGGKRILNRGFLPIKDVTRMAEDIAESRDYTKRVEPSYKHSYIETARLTNVFNSMISSIQVNFEKEKQFNQNVSHELRTPLSVVLAESEFGEKYADNLEGAKESFAIIHRQAKLMASMTEQILEISKTQQFEWSNFENFSLSDLVSEYCKTNERKWEELAVTFKIKIEPKISIRGHKILLIRMIDNQVNNALKFTESKIWITLEHSFDKAMLKVADDGIGISQDQLENIWDRFYQVDDSRNKSQNKGIGLGLSFVKDIADLHRARLEVVSKEGKGSVFSVIFPINAD